MLSFRNHRNQVTAQLYLTRDPMDCSTPGSLSFTNSRSLKCAVRVKMLGILQIFFWNPFFLKKYSWLYKLILYQLHIREVAFPSPYIPIFFLDCLSEYNYLTLSSVFRTHCPLNMPTLLGEVGAVTGEHSMKAPQEARNRNTIWPSSPTLVRRLLQ